MRRGRSRARALVVVGTIALACGAGTAFGAFGTNGETIVNVGGPNSADDVAIARNGTIVAAGSAVPGATGFDFAAVRLTNAGFPDAGFSGEGKQTTDLGGFDSGDGVAIQKDGAIVVGGSTDAIDDERRATLVRYEPDGDVDPTFSGGIQIYPFGEKPSDIEEIALQADGKIVIAGSIGSKALIARVKANGKLDRSFGNNGLTKFGVKPGTDAVTVALQKDDRIVVAGSTSGTQMESPSSQVFARLTKGGKLDESFSKDGILTRKVKGSSSRIEDVAVEKSGRILGVVGIFDSGGPDSTYGVTAVKPNGRLDKRYGKKGLAARDYGPDTSLANIAIQRGGGAVVGGAVRPSGDVDFLLSRFTKSGKLDESFGFKGATITDFNGGTDSIQGLAIGKDDVIVAAGFGDGDFGFARYLANGAIDD